MQCSISYWLLSIFFETFSFYLFFQILHFFSQILTNMVGGWLSGTHGDSQKLMTSHCVPFPSLAKIEKSWALWKTSSCLLSTWWQTASAQDLIVLSRSQLVPPPHTPKRTKGTLPVSLLDNAPNYLLSWVR